MINFLSIWALLRPQGEYKRRYRGCIRLWDSYSPQLQQRIYDTLNLAHQRGDPINPNPYFAIEDTALAIQKAPSFANANAKPSPTPTTTSASAPPNHKVDGNASTNPNNNELFMSNTKIFIV